MLLHGLAAGLRRLAGAALVALVAACGGGGGDGNTPPGGGGTAAPQITTQPQATSVDDGATASFSVTASGTTLAYQWQRNGADIAGAISASFALAPATLADDGASFRVVVSNGGGSVTSNAAALTVRAVAPVNGTQPQSIAVDAGATASFSVSATGSQPLTYQWRRNGTDIAGATAAGYTTPAVAAGDDGAQFDVVVRNAGGSVTSAAATLSVRSAGGTGGTRLSLATTHTLARRADGSIVAWGANTSGELGNGPVIGGTFARVVGSGAAAAVAAEQGGAMRKSDGTVEGWGTNTGGWLGGTNGTSPTTYLTPVPVPWSRPVREIGFGLDNYDTQDFLFALLDDGSVWHLPGARSVSGSNTSYAAAQVNGLTGASALATGHGPMHVVRSDGTVWKLDFSLNLSTLAYFATPSQVTGLAGVAGVTCGTRHCLALLNDGTVRAWGEGRSGELGHGVPASSALPVTVSALTGVTHIAVTSVYGASFARTADGKLWSWGSGEMSAQPGSGSAAPADKLVPTEVTGLAGALEVACSDRHCAVRMTDGTVWSWGDDLYQQMGNGPSTIPVWHQTPVRATGINLN